MDATVVALVIILALVLVCYMSGCFKKRKEGFVTRRAHEVCAASREIFGQKPNASYSEFKTRVPGADAVLYTDMRSLQQAGRLSPEAVQGSL